MKERTQDQKRFNRGVGDRLRRMREAAGLSMPQFGREIGITFQAVQKYERGVSAVPIYRIHQMARALGTPAEKFTAELMNFRPGAGPWR